MADYYPLLAKAIAGLPDASSEARQAIYERARKALISQLRAHQPPVPEANIEAESQALAQAVAKLEAELAIESELGKKNPGAPDAGINKAEAPLAPLVPPKPASPEPVPAPAPRLPLRPLTPPVSAPVAEKAEKPVSEKKPYCPAPRHECAFGR